ncbi:O-antigen ligase family protein [Flavobacterium sp.]|uniref:O-antigen ligase family protein n=1 Tax=Flavobacterium sp. TaxID=239 RepID=UPI0025B9594F|nr:O-antigen ligase family protein [Flavobacterium sp.]
MSRLWENLSNGHPLSFFVIVLLVCAPVKLGIGNIALILFGLAVIWQFRLHRHFSKDWILYLPMALFVLMALSLLWSIDLPRSVKALPRMIYLFLIPLLFLMFPAFSKNQRIRIMEFFGYGMSVIALFYLLKACIRFFLTGNKAVFFYHELVTEETNAIYVSVFFSVGFFALLTKYSKSILDKLCCALLALLIILLSSKNVALVWALLTIVYFVGFSRFNRKQIVISAFALICIGILSLFLFPKIVQRFQSEFNTAKVDPKDIVISGQNVNSVSISQAWNQEKFTQNDYFAGTAFRVYQVRIFTEMLGEDNIFWQGYGLNASYSKVGQKTEEHGLFKGNETVKGYQGKNFHNQYVQNFAELGIFGLLLILAMLFINLKNAVNAKDFTHISFAVLMISLFLTESFLWRQRGVTFFVLVYCLYNAGNKISLSAKKA